MLIVKAETGDDALAALIFAVLMIARAPLQLFQAVSTTLLPHLTRLLVREGEGHGGDFGRSVRAHRGRVPRVRRRDRARACWPSGPPVMRLLFGPEFDYDRLRPRDGRRRHGPVPVGHHASTRRCWPRAARAARPRPGPPRRCSSSAFLLIADMEEVREVEVAFLATAGLLSCCCPRLPRARVGAGAAASGRGSTEEMEAILAAADEGT